MFRKRDIHDRLMFIRPFFYCYQRIRDLTNCQEDILGIGNVT